MGNVTTAVENADYVGSMLAIFSELLSWSVITFVIVFLVAVFVVRRLISTVRASITGSSGSAESVDYQRDYAIAVFLWFFQGPSLGLPSIADSDITDLISEIMSWGPIQWFLTAIVAIGAIGLMIRSFRKGVTD